MRSVTQPVKRAVLYARVSTDEQAKKGYSIRGQLDELRTAVEAQGYELQISAQVPKPRIPAALYTRG
jgi:hypothetical protein